MERTYQQRLHLRRLFHLEEDLGRVNLEKNSERGRGGDDQSTSRRASIRSSAVTFPQSITITKPQRKEKQETKMTKKGTDFQEMKRKVRKLERGERSIFLSQSVDVTCAFCDARQPMKLILFFSPVEKGKKMV